MNFISSAPNYSSANIGSKRNFQYLSLSTLDNFCAKPMSLLYTRYLILSSDFFKNTHYVSQSLIQIRCLEEFLHHKDITYQTDTDMYVYILIDSIPINS